MCLLAIGLIHDACLGPHELIPAGRSRLVRYTAAVIDALPSNAAVVVAADQLSTRLGEEIVILGLRDSVYYGLSDVGARIWDLIQTPRTVDEILSALVAEYEVTAADAAAGLDRLLRDLETRGLVAITLPDRA
jgi:Coenzyme PQQ synthesis protein D (PqqD)